MQYDKQQQQGQGSWRFVRSTQLAVLLAISFVISGCASFGGAGTKDVTLSSVKIVCLSHKDTQGTITQVTENNGALRALGAPKPQCKR
jgi:hypothetical protein